MEKEKSKRVYITFTEDMLLSKREHSDPNKIDFKTKETLKICSILVPHKEVKECNFGLDANGIDRDARSAKINIPEPYIFANKTKDGQLINYFSYLDPDREYRVNFVGHVCEQVEGKVVFDKPEPVLLKGSELAEIYKQSQNLYLKKLAEKKAPVLEPVTDKKAEVKKPKPQSKAKKPKAVTK